MTDSCITLARTLGKLCKKKNLKIVTAESCTGGKLAAAITAIAGSSQWFECGIVTYSNTAKIDLLNVSPQTLTTYGAVSAETAREMATGVLQTSPASLSIAITGIAGPTGGSSEKPVGTVWFGWKINNQPPQAEKQLFQGTRAIVRQQSVIWALKKCIMLIEK